MSISHVQFMKLSSFCDRSGPYLSCLDIVAGWAESLFQFISVYFSLFQRVYFSLSGWYLFCDSGVLHLLVVTLKQWCLDCHKEVMAHAHMWIWLYPCVLYQTLHCHWDKSDISHKTKGPVCSPVVHPPGCLFSAKKSIWRTSRNKLHISV